MTLRCSSCGALLELDGAFPTAIVRCRFCSGSTVVPTSRESQAAAMPYRTAAPMPEPASRLVGRKGNAKRNVSASTLEGAPCPRCQNELANAAPSGIEVHECHLGEAPAPPGCGGVFTTHESLATLLAMSLRDETLRHATATPATASPVSPPSAGEGAPLYLRCPGCNQPMNRSRFAAELPFVIDVCKHHGIWFDRGEMTWAMGFAARGGRYDPTRHRGPRPGEWVPMAAAAAAAAAPSNASSASSIEAGHVIDGAELLVDVLSLLVSWSD